MAKVLGFGQEPQTRAFGIVDDDASGHGEWHNILNEALEVRSGETLAGSTMPAEVKVRLQSTLPPN